jgi:aryl-alcohol dehydrogenase-like predicted oxidoreductase
VLKRYDHERAWRTIEAVQRIADEIGSTPSAVSLAWLQAQSVITAPITGANSVEQLQQSLPALDITLTPSRIAELDDVSAWQQG